MVFMKALVFFCSLLAVLPLIAPLQALTLEEAGQLLGSDDESQVLRAEEVLLAGRSDALGLLTKISFGGDEQAAERAKRCRRRILYGIPSGLPTELEEGVVRFHRQELDRRKQVIEQIAEDPMLGARTLAQLHSRLLERDAKNPTLNDIRRAFVDLQRSRSKQVGLDAFDPLLLLVQSRAMVVDSLPCYSDTQFEDTYSEWVALDPSIRGWYDQNGVQWEARRLSAGKSVPEALAAVAEISNEKVRRKVEVLMYRWASEEIKDWLNCPAELRFVALEMAHAANLKDARRIYQKFIADDPGLAERLPDGLLELEVRRCLDAGQVDEACRAAAREEGRQELMKLIGKEAKKDPGFLVDGFPDPALMSSQQMAGFLDGLSHSLDRDRQDEWWAWVLQLRALSASSATIAVWQEAMLREKRFDFLLPLAAGKDDLQQWIGLAAKEDHHKTRLVLAALMRRQPDLIDQIVPGESQQGLLRSTIEALLGMPVASLDDLRMVERMLATWSVQLPGIVPDDLTGDYLPLAALRKWDAGDQAGAIRQLNEVSNQLLAARVTIRLLVEVEPEQARELVRAIELQQFTVKGWLEEAAVMDDAGLERVCDLLDVLDDEGVLHDQQRPVDIAAMNRDLLDWFHEGRLHRVQRMASSCYWFVEPEQWVGACTYAEVLRLAGGSERMQSMGESVRAQRKPLHRLVLMRSLGRDDEVASLVDSLDDSEFKERVLMEQGRYADAVRVYQKRRKESYDSRRINAAMVFEPDAAGEHDRARKVAWDHRGSVDQAWLPWLTGTAVESLAVGAINGSDGRRVVEHGALEPVMFSALESRALAAVDGNAYIDHYTMIHYTSMAPWLPDRERRLAVLRRWAEIPSERMPEVIPHMDFYTSLRVFRALLACGEVELARSRLHELLRSKGGVDELNRPEAERTCGWQMGRPWKESLAWRIIRLEHPGLDDVELLLQMARVSQELTLEAGVDHLGRLVRRHAASFSNDEQREIVRSWCGFPMEPVLDELGDLDQWLEQVRYAISHPLPIHDRSIDMQYEILGKPDELIERSTRSERQPLADGMKVVGEAWHAGRRDEARDRLRRLTMEVLLDPDLIDRVPLYYRKVQGARRLGAGNTWHSLVDHMAWHAHANQLPGELLVEDIGALCRSSSRVSGEPLERLGMIELALRHHRLAAAKRFPEPGRYLSDDDIDRVASLRRLECKLAMQRGDRDEVLNAFGRFMPKDPFHRTFLFEVRDWFSERGDSLGATEVDRLVTRFWQDRLLLLPGFRRYQLELSQWLLEVAKRSK